MEAYNLPYNLPHFYTNRSAILITKFCISIRSTKQVSDPDAYCILTSNDCSLLLSVCETLHDALRISHCCSICRTHSAISIIKFKI